MVIRVYEIEFMDYTNAMRNTVIKNTTERIYKSIPSNNDGKLLIKEDDISYWQQFGNGIKNMKYVGELHER